MERALKVSPDSIQVQRSLSLVYLKQKEWEKAIDVNLTGTFIITKRVVKEIRQAAEFRYRKKEQELKSKLSEISEKLNRLLTRGQSAESFEINSKQKRAIDSFRGEMSEIRKELRSVQHALREDIESLDSWLKFLNIGGIPVLIGVGLMIVFVSGRFQKRKKI